MEDGFMFLFENIYSLNECQESLLCSSLGSGNPQIVPRGPDTSPRAGEAGALMAKKAKQTGDSCGQGGSRGATGREARLGMNKHRARQSGKQQNVGVRGGGVWEAVWSWLSIPCQVPMWAQSHSLSLTC